MLEPRCAAELTVDEMRDMVDEMIEAHGSYMQMYD
jgi:alpha-galactosidase